MDIKLLSCPLCLHPHFNSVDSLRVALVNVASAPIPCPICNEVLMGLDKLTIHLFSHITFTLTISSPAIMENPILVQKDSVRKFITIAPAASKTPSVILTPNIVKDTPESPAQTSTNTNVIETIEELTTSPSIRCDICNFRFNDQSVLEMHQKLLHQTLADSKTGIYSYHCHLCSKKFKMKGSLMVHLRVAHSGFGGIGGQLARAHVSVEGGGETVTKSGSEDGRNNGVKQWGCDICEKMFTTKYFLKKHKRLHTGEMPYFCEQCNKSFTFQQSYHKHMLYHSTEKPHVCNDCGRAFKELSTLHNHERIHSGERPFSCETCGKCFRQRVSYLVHRRIHTGAMPYKCTACNKSFRYKVSQKSHKCTANPPGALIRTANLVQKLMDKDASLRPVPVPTSPTTQQQSQANNCCNNTEQLSPTLLNNDEFITMFPSSGDTDNKEQNELSSSTTVVVVNHNNVYNAELGDGYFTMVVSPTMPDVQSLCLNHNSPEAVILNEVSDCKDNVIGQSEYHTINEESLKELLYGDN